MTLLEFLNHLKHKSLKLELYNDNGHFIYATELGSYYNWIYRQQFDNCLIILIEALENNKFRIQIEV